MATTIELPDKLTEQVKEVVEDGRYASVSEFVRDGTRRRLEDYGVGPDSIPSDENNE